MYELLNTVNIGGVDLPIKCNISILAFLQETYGTISEFERKLIGVIPIMDAMGNYKFNQDGSLAYKQTEPSISVIKKVTPLFIREGIEKATEQGEEYSEDWKEAFENFDFDLYETALAINEEFKRCFYRKKKTNLKRQQNRKTKKSTSTE